MFKRSEYQIIKSRLEEPRRFIQVIMGPRQVGKSTVNEAFAKRFEVYYWRELDDEVDFVLRKKDSLVAIEIKGNAEKRTDGLQKFKEKFNPKAAFIVGDGGIRSEEFLTMDLNKLF